MKRKSCRRTDEHEKTALGYQTTEAACAHESPKTSADAPILRCQDTEVASSARWLFPRYTPCWADIAGSNVGAARTPAFLLLRRALASGRNVDSSDLGCWPGYICRSPWRPGTRISLYSPVWDL